MTRLSFAPFLFLCLLFAGCASYQVDVPPMGKDLRTLKKLWVKTNNDDNRAMHVRIAEGLRHEGFEVGSGPVTMKPEDFDAIVEYRDNWSWDFRTHLVGLEVKFVDPKDTKLLGIARYTASASLFNEPSEVVGSLLHELLDGKSAQRLRAAEAKAKN